MLKYALKIGEKYKNIYLLLIFRKKKFGFIVFSHGFYPIDIIRLMKFSVEIFQKNNFCHFPSPPSPPRLSTSLSFDMPVILDSALLDNNEVAKKSKKF